jgi:large subunit ribosomal protein L11
MEFIKEYNAATTKQKGQVIPAVITVFEDRTFTFITKLPPVAELIKKKLNIQKGSGKAGLESAGKITKAQVAEIVQQKMKDLNTDNIEAAKKIVEGTARSMGIQVE